MGERDRQSAQLTTLRFEVIESLLAAGWGPDRQAVEAYAGAVAGLHWSDPRIAPMVAGAIGLVREEAIPPAGDVCADMRAWVAGGYRKVTTATKESGAWFSRLLAHLVKGLGPGTESLAALLAPSEGPDALALSGRIATLGERLRGSAPGVAPATLRNLPHALGFETGGEGEAPEGHQGRVLGKGTTLGGGRFVLSAERGGTARLAGCRLGLEVEYTPPSLLLDAGLESSSVSSSRGCRPGRPQPSLEESCSDGEVTIEDRFAADVERVRLRLKDGRTFTSAAVPITRRFGGPASFYYQAFASTFGRPVELTEIGARGRVLGRIALRDIGRCRPEANPEGTPIVQGTTPDGSPYVIDGASNPTGAGHRELDLRLSDSLAPPSLAANGVSGSTVALGRQQWHLSSSCGPPPVVILYGPVAVAGDSVMARTASGLVALSAVPLPARLHVRGSLAYGAFAATPSELLLRSPSGATVSHVSLAKEAVEWVQYCEGFAES